MPETNPEKDQDRVRDTVEHFERFGYVMFPQQRAVYANIVKLVKGKSVHEAGCGNGIGAGVLSQCCNHITASDKLETNVKFAKCLYPWINFFGWDLNGPFPFPRTKFDVVVCVETFEHVGNPQQALQNLVDITISDLIISTPNGEGKYHPPHNPYHVAEYTVEQMVAMFMKVDYKNKDMELTYRDYENFREVTADTISDPAVYHLTLRNKL